MKCYKCNSESKARFFISYNVSNRGYGSIFDSSSFTFTLCEECAKPEYAVWVNEWAEIIPDYCEVYEHEEEISALIDSFPIENQEKVYNTGSFNGHSIPTQDWIDIHNGLELSDKKYKEYGIYSPKQIRAYNERFPTCNEPINVVYDDYSKGCRCVHGAFGTYGQEVGLNIDKECCGCEYYSLRNTPIKDISDKEFDEYKTFKRAEINYLRLKDKFKGE